MPRSITRRLLLSNLVVLGVFLGLAGAALDRAFRTSSETAVREQLRAHVYTLLATADEDGRGRMRLPEVLTAPAFNNPDSGLYAEVRGENGAYLWRSGSLLGRDRRLVLGTGPGSERFRLLSDLAMFELGIGWEDDGGNSIPYALGVAIDINALREEQSTFRGTLWLWLGGLAALLLAVQTLLVRWGLQPLRAMSDAVRRIEDGERAAIDGPVASELRGLSDNLNSLIRQNRTRQERIRNSLADLAHSMKTPLAVLRGASAQAENAELKALIDEQTGRINQIVSYQRQRAAVAGVSSVTRPVDLAPILQRLCNGLDKVHSQGAMHCELTMPDEVRIRADEGDLFELFGNLLENAYKHAARNIQIHVRLEPQQLTVSIDDDGPGVAADDVERILKRGERADQRNAGEGIGLAVVSEIVAQYSGQLTIGQSALGGATFQVALPL